MQKIIWDYLDDPKREIEKDFSYNKEYYESDRWLKELRPARLEIDSYTCQICGEKENLHVHHIYGIYYDDVDKDLITLCKRCHNFIHKKHDLEKEMRVISKDYNATKRKNVRDKYFFEFIDRFREKEVFYGGNRNFCNYDEQRDLWKLIDETGNFHQLLRVQAYFAELKRSHAFILHISGYTYEKIKEIVPIGKKSLNDTFKFMKHEKHFNEIGGNLMKPIDMTDVQEAGVFENPTAGAYICVIRSVTDFADKEYLKVDYDIAEGKFAGYYADLHEKHPDWSQWIGAYCKSYKPAALPMMKRFCSAVSKSNGNYVFDCGKVNADEQTLVGKKLGITLGEEEYYGNDGDTKTRLYVHHEFPIEKFDKEKEYVPNRKELPKGGNDEFVDVPAGTDEEVPF